MEKTWKDNKRASGMFAAIILMLVSAIGFTSGLSFGGDYGFLVGGAVWLALTIIQMLGNDEENRQDGILMIGWIFTYVLGIGASTWAMYSWIQLPPEADWLRWIISFGLGGATEVLPERLIYLYIKSKKAPLPTPIKPQTINRPVQSSPSSYRPQPMMQGKPQQQNQKPYQPITKPPQRPQTHQPTYLNLFHDEDEK